MLVLSRKPGEKLMIGRDITITLLEANGNRVRLGIEAPADVPILRAELCAPAATSARVDPLATSTFLALSLPGSD
jgi:carbon storage regulator